MRKRKMLGLLVAALLLPVVAASAEQATKIRWVVKAEQSVDKSQAEVLYVEACRWMEGRLSVAGRSVCPRITVHVGEACPAAEISGTCMNPALGVLYLPEWNADSLEAVAQVIVMTALHQLMNPSDSPLMAMLSRPHNTHKR